MIKIGDKILHGLKVGELIEQLKQYDPELPVCIMMYDARSVNLGTQEIFEPPHGKKVGEIQVVRIS